MIIQLSIRHVCAQRASAHLWRATILIGVEVRARSRDSGAILFIAADLFVARVLGVKGRRTIYGRVSAVESCAVKVRSYTFP